MNRVPSIPLARTLVVLASVALAAACADTPPLAPDREARTSTDGTASSTAACDVIDVPAGNRLAFRTFATGVQVYRWSGASWTFVAPVASLFADDGGRGTVGVHYAGPTWRSVSGSSVTGAVLERCTPGAAAIPWLLLAATPGHGPGVFQRTTYIQRINTVGGLAPSLPGDVVGEEARIPYTADYLFYRAN